MENIIKQKLIERGFSEQTLLNNRGLIGACIEEIEKLCNHVRCSEQLKDKEREYFSYLLDVDMHYIRQTTKNNNMLEIYRERYKTLKAKLQNL